MIQCIEAVKTYKKKDVLDRVTAHFAAGLIHGIIGRNGSGKTMLFKGICGLISLTSGTISVKGKEVKSGQTPDRLGAIIEAPSFLPYYSGYQNLKMLASINGKIEKTRISDAICLVGLDPGNRKWVSKYSMGMKQRLGIAQAIMEDPDLLILDEPMNGLDNAGVADMRKLLLELKARGKTILLASHNKDDIEALSDTVSEMDAGRLTRVR